MKFTPFFLLMILAGGVAFAVAVFAALLTSFYSWRLIFLTFYGKPRWSQSEHIQHAAHDAHGHGDHGHGGSDRSEECEVRGPH